MTSRELAERVCQRLVAAGCQAYLVGGCVRDLLFGREPADYDVATDAIPDRVVEIFPGSLTVGAQFGVVIIAEGGLEVHVATFRSETGYTDGRRPDQVTFAASPGEDARRRDFTINALFMVPESGEILDFTGGRADMDAHIIRAIGDPNRRFREDRLRMARAVRFAARLGYNIELETFEAIQREAEAIITVSPERLRDECTRILTEGSAARGFELLDASGLLVHTLPEISRMKGVPQPPQYHPEGDVWIHTLLLLSQLRAGVSATLAWGALLHDVGKPPTFAPPVGIEGRIRFDGHAEMGAVMARTICERFRFSTDDTEQIVALVAQHMRFKDVLAMRPSTLKRFVRQPFFEEHLELNKIDCQGSNGNMESYEFVANFMAATPPEQVRPARLISGDDLKKMGLPPGPRYREVLQKIEDAQLEGRIATTVEALEMAGKIVREEKDF
jgi:poly(A) polymerase